MGVITAIRHGRGRSKRVNVFLDGKFAFSLEAEVVVKEGLRTGQELSDSRVEFLTGADKFQRCFDTALHYNKQFIRNVFGFLRPCPTNAPC